jgi:hypothetical protein
VGHYAHVAYSGRMLSGCQMKSPASVGLGRGSKTSIEHGGTGREIRTQEL